jgi:hypothetical protein
MDFFPSFFSERRYWWIVVFSCFCLLVLQISHKISNADEDVRGKGKIQFFIRVVVVGANFVCMFAWGCGMGLFPVILVFDFS